MQANSKAHLPDLGHGRRQAVLQGRFAAAEHHRVEQALAALEECQHLVPIKRLTAARRDQLRVVAVTATPGATLAKQYAGQLARVVEGGQGHHAPDP
ncbi:hypothetical protein D3C77_571740 [compost metagenome]